MKFFCRRSSLSTYDETEKPLPECYGRPASDEDGEEDAEWWIDVPDMDALMALVAQEGKVVIFPPDPKGIDDLWADGPTLEIYDTWRE